MLCARRPFSSNLATLRLGEKTARQVRGLLVPSIALLLMLPCCAHVCVRIVVSLLTVLPTDFVVTRTAEPFRLRLAAGTKGATLLRCPRRRRRERSCRRDFAGLSPTSPPLHCCSFSAKDSRRRMWGLSVCSVYLRGRKSGMGHSWRAAAKLWPNLPPETDCVPVSIFFFFAVARANRHLLLPLGCTFFFCLPLRFPFLPSPSL